MGAVAGKVMMRPRGDYDPSAVYDILDLVKHNNKPWICKQNNIMDIEPSEANSEHWMLFIDISVADADTLDGFHASYFAPASMLKLGVYNVFPLGSDVTSTMDQIFDACSPGVTFLPPNWTCATYSPTGENGAWQIIIFKNENGTAENGYKQYMSALGINKKGTVSVYNRDTNTWTDVFTSANTIPVISGGTGATTAEDALKNLGALAVHNSLEEIGLTAGTETMAEIAVALPNNSVLYMLCNDNNNAIADGTAYPVARNGAVRRYGFLRVEKITADRVVFEFTVNDASEIYTGFYRSGTGWGGWIEHAFYKDVVPTTRTVNDKPLSANITLNASDVGARPSNWMPTASDVGAAPSSHTHSYAASSHNHAASEITSGTLGVARGGTGATTFTSGAALIGAGTGAVTTRSITNNTSSTAVTANTNLVTANTLHYHTAARLNRTDSLTAANTSYTTHMARAIALSTSAPSSLTNGCVTFVYA